MQISHNDPGMHSRDFLLADGATLGQMPTAAFDAT
jgi:hypothetical protein